MNKVLIHTCCGPCSIYPIRVLREENYEIMGFFYKANIHPYTEALKREETLKYYAQDIGLKITFDANYNLEEFIRNIAFRESKPNRCLFCYYERLKITALLAKKSKFDYFTTTLLYSKFQNHEAIKNIGEEIAKNFEINFLYKDFRIGWKEGVLKSKELKMYRQQYCGCIYSEKERFLGVSKIQDDRIS